MPLIHLVYVSSATKPFTDKDLLDLLDRTRQRNEQSDVTGLLLFRDGNFMQVLEGEENAVLETHTRIITDPRHSGLITLLKEPIPERSFSGWSMSFRNLGLPETLAIPGYSEFLNMDWRDETMRTTPDRALRLLNLFRKNMS